MARRIGAAPGLSTRHLASGSLLRMPSLLDDISAGAEWVAEALRSSGYRADFSPASLWEVERFFEEHTRSGEPRRGGLLAEDTGSRLFSLGAYVGEVIRRAVGGEWAADDTDPQGELNVALTLLDGSTVWPVQRVVKRLQNSEDSIAAYGAALGVEPGPRPAAPTKRGFFRRQR